VQVAPEDIPGLTEAIERLLGDPSERQRRSAQGLERAAQFTWEHTAAQTVEVYRKVLAEI